MFTVCLCLFASLAACVTAATVEFLRRVDTLESFRTVDDTLTLLLGKGATEVASAVKSLAFVKSDLLVHVVLACDSLFLLKKQIVR